MRAWIEPPEEIRPADWWEVATYIVLIALLLALMAHEERAQDAPMTTYTEVQDER